ncbi:hypothetical protein YSY43_04950 [Paenibacillus sp. YSY-4.3]
MQANEHHPVKHESEREGYTGQTRFIYKKELAESFRKIEIPPGEWRTVSFSLGLEELGFWNREMRFAAEPCRVAVQIGGSSQYTASAELKITS